MPSRFHCRSSTALRWGALILVTAVAATGCKPEPAVSKYTAPHTPVEASPEPDLPEDPAAGERILGLVAPAAGPKQPQWWFFKLRGRPKALEHRAANLRALAGTLKFPENEDTPKFDLPKGWEQGKPANQFSAFSIRTGHPYTPNRIDVSQTGGSLVENINRWRGQVGLDALGEAELMKTLTELKSADGKTVYWVDLTGPGGAAKGPFAK
jgi:hypothetical protein